LLEITGMFFAASQLRRKLRYYFENNGRDEPFVVDIPGASDLAEEAVRHVARSTIRKAVESNRTFLWTPIQARTDRIQA
jgi:hypothetical protein